MCLYMYTYMHMYHSCILITFCHHIKGAVMPTAVVTGGSEANADADDSALGPIQEQDEIGLSVTP